MKMEQCSETSAYKIQTPGKLPRRKHTIFRTRRKFEILDKAVPVHVKNAYGGTEVQLHSFITSALDEGKRSTSRHGRFILGKAPPHPLNRRLCELQGWSGSQ
jgi:hypothetical protein